MKFKIDVKKSAQKDIRDLPEYIISKIIEIIDELKISPLPHGAIKLKGADNLYRIRIGDYRIIYEIQYEQNLIIIQYVRHRRDAYKNLYRK